MNVLSKKYNNLNELKYVNDKWEFSLKYKKYLKREVISIDNSSEYEINQFLKRHKNIIIKPRSGNKGIGVKKIKTSTLNINVIKDQYQGYIFEEVIVQNSKMNLLNDTSINTVRVVTTKNKNGLTIIGAVIRMGRKGMIVDNFSQNGILADVDVDNGMVITNAFDSKRKEYIYHPDSNIKIKGFKIPNWKELLKVIEDASEVSLGLNYLGWDFAILEEGVDIIEINSRPGARSLQICSLKGNYYKIKKTLENMILSQ